MVVRTIFSFLFVAKYLGDPFLVVPLVSHCHCAVVPQRLLQMLNDEENQPIVSWLPHGKGWVIHNKQRFSDFILPKYFKKSKFTSFTRKLNRWYVLGKRPNPRPCLALRYLAVLISHTTTGTLQELRVGPKRGLTIIPCSLETILGFLCKCHASVPKRLKTFSPWIRWRLVSELILRPTTRIQWRPFTPFNRTSI